MCWPRLARNKAASSRSNLILHFSLHMPCHDITAIALSCSNGLTVLYARPPVTSRPVPILTESELLCCCVKGKNDAVKVLSQLAPVCESECRLLGLALLAPSAVGESLLAESS